MKFYTHIAGAILFYLILAHFLNPGNLILNVLIVSVVAITPDIIDRLSGSHRGMGHSILWIIPIIFVGRYNFVLGATLMVGFLSHIVLDVFTVNGCPLYTHLKRPNLLVWVKKGE
jgi:inner membrane protein